MAHALFPGSFDPFTNGHLDLATRAATLFGKVTVAIGRHATRDPMFSLEERIEMVHAELGDDPRVEITSFDGLTVDYAQRIGAAVVIRGVRAMSDFEYEFEMALMNRHLEPSVEIIFLASSQDYIYVSSSRLKELARFGASVADFVPPLVGDFLKRKITSN